MFASLLLALKHSDTAATVLDLLDQVPYDFLGEIDYPKDRHHTVTRVEGKYFLPILDSSFSDFYAYAAEHMVHPDDAGIYLALFDPATIATRLAESPNPGVLHASLRLRLLDGGWRWAEQVIVGGHWHGLEDGHVRAYLLDTQYQHDRQEGKISTYPATGDRNRLTGLLTEQAFFETAAEMLASRTVRWSLAAIDIENFQLFNDWYGREAGNLVLAQVGGLLKREANHTGGLAGYRGNDDFCILLPHDQEHFERIFDDIHALIKRHGSSIGFMPAIGICRMEEETIPVRDALDCALLAVSHTKGNYRTRIRLYDESMRNKKHEEYLLLSEFQRALTEGEISFYLQPQCRISTKLIVGAEALARWRKPDGTIISPSTFVPVLERYGFVTDLDQFIWEEVCAWLSRSIAAGKTVVPISVNVSQTDILAIDVPEKFATLVDKYSLPTDLIKIEMTESAYVADTALVTNTVQRLHDMGFLVLMDDFGSGYSSLNMLRRLSVDVVKLDAQFLRLNERDDRRGVHILETIINMTRTMALPIVMEGVETQEQVEFLENLGCRYVQGFYYYHPMTCGDFERLMDRKNMVDLRGFMFKANQQFEVREFMDANIYNDSMLNNIIGAAVFYSWDGEEDVDIVRFNEQFYRLVGAPDFEERISHIQRYINPPDVSAFIDALRQAEQNHLNGASGVFGVYRADGSLGRFDVRIYHLENRDTRKLFYAALREVTQIADLQNEVRLISTYSSFSTVFLRKRTDGWSYQVVVHGLEEDMGMNVQEFEEELTSGRFYGRVDSGVRERLHKMTMSSLNEGMQLAFPCALTRPDGSQVQMQIKCDAVNDPHSDVCYILNFRMAGE